MNTSLATTLPSTGIRIGCHQDFSWVVNGGFSFQGREILKIKNFIDIHYIVDILLYTKVLINRSSMLRGIYIKD